MVFATGCSKDNTDDVTSVQGVTLSKTTLTLEVGKTETLIAAITPDNAIEKTVAWTSSKPDVATVDDNGKVEAKAAGETTITATTKDGGKTATCKVTVEGPKYITVNGIKVATGNLVFNATTQKVEIGAPTDGGLFFQFGSLVGWSDADLAIAVKPEGCTVPATWNSSWTGDPVTDNEVAGTGDPCRYYLKGTWRLPTSAEFGTLIPGYSNDWSWNNGAASHTSGLKLPASGYRYNSDGSLNFVGSFGRYWSSSPYGSDGGYSYSLLFQSSLLLPVESSNRARGLAVRCVQEQ